MKKNIKNIFFFISMGGVSITPVAYGDFWSWWSSKKEKGLIMKEESDIEENLDSEKDFDLEEETNNEEKEKKTTIKQNGVKVKSNMLFKEVNEMIIKNDNIKDLKILGDKNHQILVQLLGTKEPDIKIKEYRGEKYGDEDAHLHVRKKDGSAVVKIDPSSKKLHYVIEVPEKMNVLLTGKNIMLIAKDMAKESDIEIRASQKYRVHTIHNKNESEFVCRQNGSHVYKIDGFGDVKEIRNENGGVNFINSSYYDVLKHLLSFRKKVNRYDQQMQDNADKVNAYYGEKGEGVNIKIENMYKKEIKNIAVKYEGALYQLFPFKISKNLYCASQKFLGERKENFLDFYNNEHHNYYWGNEPFQFFFDNVSNLTPEILQGKEKRFLEIQKEMEREVQGAFERYQKKIPYMEGFSSDDKDFMEKSERHAGDSLKKGKMTAASKRIRKSMIRYKKGRERFLKKQKQWKDSKIPLM